MIEESGPPAPKVLRLLYFVGAGIICTAAINKWRELEKKSLLQNQLPKDLVAQNPSNAANKAFK